jgi:hypothetical protein
LAARTRSSSRTPLAVLLGLIGVVVIPAGIAYSHYSPRLEILQVGWLVPVAGVASAAALLMVRGTRGHVCFERVRGVRAARILGVIGLCLTLAAAIALGFYEVLLRLEH